MANFHVEEIRRAFCASLRALGWRGTILRRTLMYRRDEGGNNGTSSRSYWQEGCRKTGRHCSSRPASAVSTDNGRFRAAREGIGLAFSMCHRGHAFNFVARNYILCGHYTVREKSACIRARHLVLLRFFFNFFLDPRRMPSESARSLLSLQYFTFAGAFDICL